MPDVFSALLQSVHTPAKHGPVLLSTQLNHTRPDGLILLTGTMRCRAKFARYLYIAIGITCSSGNTYPPGV